MWCYCTEAIIVFFGHGDVYVVIPRDEASMAYGSKAGASVDEVVDAVFSAQFVDNGKNLALLRLEAFERVVRIRINGHMLPCVRGWLLSMGSLLRVSILLMLRDVHEIAKTNAGVCSHRVAGLLL